MWSTLKLYSNYRRTKITGISLNFESLPLRDVPSSILHSFVNDTSRASLALSDCLGQSFKVSSSETSSTDDIKKTDSGDMDNSSDDPSQTARSTSESESTLDTKEKKKEASKDEATGSGSKEIPTSPVAVSIDESSTSNTSVSGTNSNLDPTTIASSEGASSTSSAKTGANTASKAMSPDDDTNQTQNQNGSNPAPPQIVDFAASENANGIWEFTGTVIDSNPAGLVVKFGGQPESLQGTSTTTDAYGNFDFGIQLNTNGTDNGTATAVTTDGQGLTSNVAMCVVNAS